MTAAWGAILKWPITPAGRAIQKQAKADGLCFLEPTPFLATLDELRTIRIGRNEVVFNYNNSGDVGVRTVRLNASHPATSNPRRQKKKKKMGVILPTSNPRCSDTRPASGRGRRW